MNDNSRLDNRSPYLMHYGTPRHSGRYPWGSGDDPYQHGSGDFSARVEQMKKDGLKEPEIRKALGVSVKEYKTLKLISENERINNEDFVSKINEQKALGKTKETELAEALGMSTTKYRALRGVARADRRTREVEIAKELSSQGKNPTEIARIMGKPGESSVRSLLNTQSEENMTKVMKAANYIQKQVDTRGLIDVGVGVEKEPELGNISSERLSQVLEVLKDKGYEVYTINIPQPTNPGQQTKVKIVAPKGTKKDQELYKRITNGELYGIKDYISDDLKILQNPAKPPVSISSSRVAVRYAEDGGKDKDGLIEIRPGVEDLSLGKSKYAQVRIAVDKTHYLKGMAVYSDNVPDGYDIIFNTNKTSDVPKKKVLKELNDDADNPFGAVITAEGQTPYIGKDGKEHLSAINKLHSEGDYSHYSKELPAQFLSKQPRQLIKKQLDLTYSDKKAEFEEICKLNNPAVKKHYLSEFANECDSAAVHLQAAALPRNSYQVILPVPEMNDNEVYAPAFRNGEKIALIRFPHAGTFEIPILKNNKNQPDAVKAIGNATDAVGINSNVAGRLSGADFDGDTVLAIPIGKNVKIQSTKALTGLVNFEPQEKYGYDDIKTDAEGNPHYYRNGKEYKVISESYKQKQMGIVSNLITDMTIRGAEPDEMARAVRHSMVVIDSLKHKLDYRQSEKDNDIKSLKNKYQKHILEDGTVKIGGASTLVSRAKSKTRIPKRQGSGHINQEGKPWYNPNKPIGAMVYKETENSYVNKKGKTISETQVSNQMMDTDDAYTLSSGHPVENMYANYANRMKALANEARKTLITTPNLKYSKSAKETYSKEVESLYSKLRLAQLNSPRERQALVIANSIAKAKHDANPDMEDKEYMKIKTQEVIKARALVGSSSKDRKIEITDKEWEAIQAGAISDTKLSEILRKTDADKLRERATPSNKRDLSTAQVSKIKAMHASGYTLAEIADALHVSRSTVSDKLN